MNVKTHEVSHDLEYTNKDWIFTRLNRFSENCYMDKVV